MAARSLSCPKCKGSMEPGVIPDFGYGNVFVSSWQEGAADKNWLGSLKARGRTRHEITAYRCRSCGYLECYANPKA
jgi:uncharacterized protein DUF6487